jgi:outer membrane biogenesis lipoprotein LolB
MDKSFTIKILLLLSVLILLTACASSIEDVKNSDNVGKKVTVSGTVKTTFKLGSLSGYILEDETGSISISSEELPKEGAKKTVRGTLIKDTIFGYYVKVE